MMLRFLILIWSGGGENEDDYDDYTNVMQQMMMMIIVIMLMSHSEICECKYIVFYVFYLLGDSRVSSL